MNGHSSQSPGAYPPASQPVGNPNSGCALAAECVAFILSAAVLSNFVFVSQKQKLVEPGILFPKYETVIVTSWLPVMFWAALFCGVVYGLGLVEARQAVHLVGHWSYFLVEKTFGCTETRQSSHPCGAQLSAKVSCLLTHRHNGRRLSQTVSRCS